MLARRSRMLKRSASRPISRVLYGLRVQARENVAAIPLERMSPCVSRDLPGRQAGKCLRRIAPSRRPYSVLLPVGFALPPLLPGARWALTPPFHPCPAQKPGGLLSVALSLGLPPPGVTRHRISMEPGLSSPAAFQHSRVRPPGRLAGRLESVGRAIATQIRLHGRAASTRWIVSSVPRSASPLTSACRKRR